MSSLSLGYILKQSVVYQATLTTENNRPDQTYVGLTENSFNTRFTNYKASFNHPSKKLNTEPSKHIWQLKDAKINFPITWKILKGPAPCNPASNCCNLYLYEKYFIICTPHIASLNKQNELVTSCCHASKFLLKNLKAVT